MIMSIKKSAVVLFASLGLLLGIGGISQAMQLLSQEEALKQMFPDTDAITTETINLTGTEIARIKSRLGGQLVHFQAGSQSEKVGEKTAYTFYVGKKGGKVIRVAIIDIQPGKWGPVEFIVAINPDTRKIQTSR
jgi:hypothetical protein